MDGIRENLIEVILGSGFQASFAVAGGGIGAVHALLSRPGASRFVCDVRIPYSREAMDDFLDDPPSSYCSEGAARKMAQTALEQVAPYAGRALGIACTAALQTNHERADADRAYCCVSSADRTVCEKVELEPGLRSIQDEIVSTKLLLLIARFVAE